MKKQLLFSIFNPLLTTFFFLHTSCVSQNTIVAKNKCGAYIAPGEWKEFMCYNLGAANPKADPFIPSWEINGGYWQWGQLQMASTGPSGPGSSQGTPRPTASCLVFSV
ncbi:MAG: hypothetical protein LW693_04075, partial [Saprospiraceae bacterium]|nr:hypothetical protein [Saprospiraceae bacterium]